MGLVCGVRPTGPLRGSGHRRVSPARRSAAPSSGQRQGRSPASPQAFQSVQSQASEREWGLGEGGGGQWRSPLRGGRAAEWPGQWCHPAEGAAAARPRERGLQARQMRRQGRVCGGGGGGSPRKTDLGQHGKQWAPAACLEAQGAGCEQQTSVLAFPLFSGFIFLLLSLTRKNNGILWKLQRF